MQDTNSLQDTVIDRTQRARNARNIGLGTAIAIGLATSVPYIFYPESFNILLFSINLLLVALALFGTWLASRNRVSTSAFILIGGLLVNVIGRVFIVKGLSIPVGIAALIITLTIAVNTLPIRQIGWVLVSSFAIISASVLIDQYTINVPFADTLPIVTPVTLGLTAVYLGILAYQFNRFQLRAKLIIGLILISSIPLLIQGWQSYIQSRNVILQQVISDLTETASQNGFTIREFIDSQINIMQTEAQLGDIVGFLKLSPADREGSEEGLHSREILNTLTGKDAVYILSYNLLDAEGRVLIDTNRANEGKDFSSNEVFTKIKESGSPAISSARYAPGYDRLVLYFAVPVMANGRMTGVLMAVYDAEVLQSIIVKKSEAQSTATEYVFMVDQENLVVLAHSRQPDLLHKTFKPIPESEVARLEGNMILPPGPLTEAAAAQPEISENLLDFSIQKVFTAPALEYDGQIVQMSAVQVENLPWIMVAAQPQNTIDNLTQGQVRNAVINILIFITVIAGLAYVISNIFTRPINELTAVAARITQGDFTAKAGIQSKDEVGLLASTFNSMTSQIQELVSSLENRVSARTAELEKTSQQSEQRAQELQTVTEVARLISTEKDPNTLLPLITKTVSERFGHYHTGIFLLDAAGKFAVLRAANSPGGQVMLKRQHKLEVGQVGIVGNVTATGVPRIALDTGADAVYFNNPDLPETRSEISLPLIARGTIIGALDVQSLVPNAFSDRDISLLGVLADQIAIAIDNARLIEEANNALAESQAVFREYLSETWQKRGGDSILGYRQTLTGGKVITKSALEDLQINPNGAIEFPIKVREQVIGYLNINPVSENRAWLQDDLNVVEAVAERLGLALENARLFEETSSRAARERTVTDITTKIRSTNNPQDMIKIAMEELQRALGVSKVEILPQKNTPPPDR